MHQSWLLRMFCSSLCLLCFSVPGLCLLLDASSLKKRSEMYVFPLCHSYRACSSDYFWTVALSWQVPKRRRHPPPKKPKLGDDVASRPKNRDFFKALHRRGLWSMVCPQARWCSQQRVGQHSWALETTEIQWYWSFCFYSCNMATLIIPGVYLNSNSAKN